MLSKGSEVILGIDPGLASLGWGIVAKNKNTLIVGPRGCITTSKTSSLPKRLQKIYQEITKIIKKYRPQAIAVEQLFFYKNLKTAIVVSQARGVILLVGEQTHTPLREFTPLEVKQAICGYGRADKQQIQKMTKILLNLKKLPQPDDTADALAIAICCLTTKNLFRLARSE